MMHPLHGLIEQLTMMAGNLAYNLDFVPDDKLNWKPAPTAASALEIANHVLEPLRGMASQLRTGEFNAEGAQATNRAEAQQFIVEAANDYAAALRELKAEDLQGTISLPFGEVPKGMAISIPVVDLIHHHGQIAYLQTMWGDAESHFAPDIM
jgi:uncharacterized damage-inducible protein DinB